MKIFNVILVLGCWVSSEMLHAQNLISVHEVLEMIDTQYPLSKTEQSLVDYLDKAKNSGSRIDKMEFRTETDRWDLAKQEYLFRTSFRSKGEVAADRKQWKVWKDIVAGERQEKRSKYWKEVYHDLVDILISKKKIRLQKEMTSLLNDEKTILLSNATYGKKVDVLAILKIENELIDVDLRLSKLEGSIRDLKGGTVLSLGEMVNIDFTGWEDTEAIRVSVLQMNDRDHKGDVVMIEKAKVRKSEIALKKELAEGSKVLDFVQLKYTGKNEILYGNRFSLGVGLVIPSGDVNKSKITEATIDLYRKNIVLEKEVAEQKKKENEAVRSYRNSATRLSTVKEKIEKLGLEKVLEKLQNQNNISPSSLVKVKKMILKRNIEILDLENTFYNKYIDMLYVEGRFGSENVLKIFIK